MSLKRDMVLEMREVLGDGYVPEYYENEAANFVSIAEWHMSDLQAKYAAVVAELEELQNKNNYLKEDVAYIVEKHAHSRIEIGLLDKEIAALKAELETERVYSSMRYDEHKDIQKLKADAVREAYNYAIDLMESWHEFSDFCDSLNEYADKLERGEA